MLHKGHLPNNSMPTLSPLILNSNNIVSGTNNSKMTYRFPGNVKFNNAKVAVSQISLYYSWPNITSTYGNNTFSIIVPVGASTQQIDITLSDGTYSVEDLNAYIQSQLVTEGIGYLADADGNYVYYIELVANSVSYAIQLNCYSCPTALPSGYSNPGGWSLPTTAYTPQLVVNNNAFQQIIGFTAGTFPDPQQTSSYSVLSTSVPELSPVSSIILCCNLLQNKLSNPQTVLYSFTNNGVSYGNLITSQPFQYSFVDVADGDYSSIELTFLDQNFNLMSILDPNIVVTLLLSM